MDAAPRLGASSPVIYAGDDAVNQIQQLVKIIQDTQKAIRQQCLRSPDEGDAIHQARWR